MKFAISRSNYLGFRPNSEQPMLLPLRQRRSMQSGLSQLWQQIVSYFNRSSELQVWSTQDEQGQVWWSAYDPITKRSVNQIAEAQMRTWIDQRHLNQVNSRNYPCR